MAFEVVLPKLGQTMTEGTIVSWSVKEGDSVNPGDVLFEVETDKTTLEVEATQQGVLRKILLQPGTKVPILTPVAILGSPDEDISQYGAGGEPADADNSTPTPSSDQVNATPGDPVGPPSVTTAAEAPPKRVIASPRARALGRERGLDLSVITGSGPGGRIVEDDVLAHLESQPRATPVARKVAEAAQVDLAGVTGTGPGGRVTRGDVELVTARKEAPAAAPALEPAPVAESKPMSGLRAIIAERMAISHQTTARVTLTSRADATDLVALRTQLKDAYADQLGFSIGYNDLLIHICARALRESPNVNTQLVDGEIRLLSEIHVGLAVDTERGLLVPVIRNADRRGVVGIATEVRELVQRARAGKSLPDDLSGGTFTITNLGMFEIDAFTPIINLPECAILGVGRIVSQPAVVGDKILPRQTVWLSLTFDHRLVDGAPAARFLRLVKRYVESPYLLLA